VKETVFTPKHIALGAKMAPFAGYNMPIEYSGLIKEHTAVREGVGLFDVSHMGEIWVMGAKATALLQYITSNDISALYPGRAQYSCLPNGRGGIVDDLIVYCFGPEKYLLGVNAANTDKDWEHICSFADKFGMKVGIDLVNASDDTCQLAIQGPKAMELMQKLCSESIMDMSNYTFKQLTVAGIENALLATTGYTGSGGCEVYVTNADGLRLWDAIMDAGEPYGIVPVGLGARDTLRLEKGYLLYGNDMDDTTSPLEAGLGWITKFSESKGDFVDKEYMLAQKTEGLKRRLVAFELIEKGIARHGYSICDADGNQIGHVTSGTMGPTIKKAIGLGYVDAPYYKTGSEIFINVRDRLLKAQVVKAPFC
jgi:aminomethyltransferase